MADVVRCPTCKRPYNRDFAECPFCARAAASYRDVPRPSRSSAEDEFRSARREIEEAESRGRGLVVVLAVLGFVSIVFAFAASGAVSVFGHAALNAALAIGLFGSGAGAWFARRVARDISVMVVGLVFGYVAVASFGYLAVTGLNALGGTWSEARCAVTGRVYSKRSGSAVSAYFTCQLPNGESATGTARFDFPSGQPFTLAVRRGALGIWTFDPASAR